MLDHIKNTQQMADLFKAVVLDADEAPQDERLSVLRTISLLERCGWHRGVMRQAITESAPTLTINEAGAVALEGDAAEQLDAIQAVIINYLDTYGYEYSPTADLYTLQEAADYLGISAEMMTTYVTRRGKIKGERIGRSWVFTRAELERFKATKRSPGRPPAENP